MEKLVKVVGTVVIALGVIALVAFLMAYPTEWLVNYLISPSAMMTVFGIPALTFWKALALNMLCGALISKSSSEKK